MISKLYLFIIWKNFINKKNIVIKDLEKKYIIREIYEIKWDDEDYIKNLHRFYGGKLANPVLKSKITGKGSFLLILITDTCPKLEKKALDDVNLVEFNSNVLDSKMKYRKLIGEDFAIHCSISDEETNHDLALLLGKTSQDLEKELPKKWNGLIKKIENPDLVGHNGWKTMKQFFDVLNATTNYVVLRNFEDLPDKILHQDIDILTDDVKNMSLIVNEENPDIDLPIIIDDNKISIDFRYQIGRRYDEKWAKDILKRRIMGKGGFYVPCKEDYFYTLFYHNIGNDSNEYKKILTQLATEIGINENINEILNDNIKSEKFLKRYMIKMKYKQTNTKSRIIYKINQTEIIRLVKVSVFLTKTYGIMFFLGKMKIKVKNTI